LSGDKNVNAKMYFVGYGLNVPALNRNDLGEVDLRGKIVVLRDGPPPGIGTEQWKKASGTLNVWRGLIQRGAGAIVTVGQDTETLTFSELADYLTRRQIEPDGEGEMPAFLPPFISISEAAAEKLFAASGVTRDDAFTRAKSTDFRPIDLNQNGTVTVKLKKAQGAGSNVVGLLEGSDPKLKS